MSARRPSAATEDISSFIFGSEQPTATLCLNIYNNLLSDSSKLSDIFTDDDTLFELLSKFEVCTKRITRFFTIVNERSTDLVRQHPRTMALRKEIVEQFLLPLLGVDFEIFHSQPAFMDLIASIIQFNLSVHPGALKALAECLVEKRELLGLLISGHGSSSVMKDWIAKFCSSIRNPEIFESWTSALISLCKNCKSDHGVSLEIHRWYNLIDLKEHLKAARKQRLNNSETGRGTQRTTANISFSRNDLVRLRAFDIKPPSSETKLISALAKLENDETLLIMQNLANTFPCRRCNEAGERHAVEANSLSYTGMDLPRQFSELFGRKLGIWRVHLSAQALKDFRESCFEGNFEHIKEKLIQLASGEWDRRSLVRGAGSSDQRHKAHGTLREAVFGSNGRILWQVDVDFDEDTNNVTQVLKVWKIGDHKEMEKAINSVLNLQKNYSAERMDACKQTNFEESNGRYMPVEFTDDSVLKLEQIASVESMEFNSEDEKALESILLLNKFYALTETAVDNLFSKNANVEYPLVVSKEELDVIKDFKTSTLVLGRSGTGKTTCLVYKLISRYLSTSEIQQGKPLRQILLTRSPILAYKLGRQTKRLIDTQKGDITDNVEDDLWAGIDDYDKEVTGTIKSLKDEDFPLVCTFDHFLKLLENTIRYANQKDFSAKSGLFPNGKNDHQMPDSNEYGRKFGSRFHSRKSQDVDFQVFKDEYWCTFPRHLKNKLPEASVFMEIMGVIKGSASAETQFKPLSREKYQAKSFKSAPSFHSTDERGLVYDIYEVYEKEKRKRQALDNIDRVIPIFREISENEYVKAIVGEALDEIYVDEVQDQRLLEITLLVNLIKDPRGIHFAGDTAQCISKDSTFRFEDVKALLFRNFSRLSAIANAPELAKPNLIKLDKNFRAHQGILSFASFIMNLLWTEFPAMVDKLPPEIGEYSGPKPTILVNSGSFFTSVLQSVELRPRAFDFGAQQVIIVRDKKDKERLRDDIGRDRKILILTILESKGMEFDDVFLLDFFTTSQCQNSFLALASRRNANRPENLELCTELKQLYVAITRPRSRLWLLESDPSSIKSINELLRREPGQPLVDIVFVEDTDTDENVQRIVQKICYGRTSNSLEWSTRGREFLCRQDYENAKFCFENAKDTRGIAMTRAFIEEQKGRTHQALGDEAEFKECLREAARLFRDSKLPFKEATCYEDLEEFLNAAEIFLANGAYEKAASLLEQAERYEEASNSYIRAGNYEEGAGSLHRGCLFDKLICYLNKHFYSIDSKTHSRYSKLCYLLLKQGKISYPETMTMEALGSESKKTREMENIWSFVIYHNLRRQIPRTELNEIFNFVQARSLRQRLSSEPKTILIRNEKWYPRNSLIPEISPMRESWKQLARTLNNCQDQAIDYENLNFGRSWMKAFFSVIVTTKATHFIDAAEKISELPIEFVNEVTDMIKLLDTDGKFAPALLLFLGIFPVSKKAGTYRLLNWSPLNPTSDGTAGIFGTAAIVDKVRKWALDRLHPAITQIHIKALELQKKQYPRRCHSFWTTMSSRNMQRGICELTRTTITKEEFSNFTKDLLRMCSLYSAFGPLYNLYGRRPAILDQEFAESFSSHRQIWTERLIVQITFFSSFEHDASILAKTYHEISRKSSKYFGVMGELENLLFYRIRHEMKQRHNFSYLLEQLQLAETLGIADRFMECLTNAFRDVPSYPTKNHARSTLTGIRNLGYDKVLGSSETHEQYETVFRALEQFPIEDFPSFHAVIAFYEKLTTFLIYMSRPTDFLMPNSWVQMYLLQMPGLFTKKGQVRQLGMSPIGIQQVESPDFNVISEYWYQKSLLSAVESFCILIGYVLDHDGAVTTMSAGSRYLNPQQYLARRQIDFLAVTMANLRTMSPLLSLLSVDITRVLNTVQTIIARLSVNASDVGWLPPQMLAAELLEMFKQYNENDFLLIVTEGGTTSHAFSELHELGVSTVSMNNIWSSKLQGASASVPARNAECQLNSGYCGKKKKWAAEIIQNFWRTRSSMVRQRGYFLASPTGKAHVFIQKLREKILKKDVLQRERLERTILLVRDGTELYLRVKGLEDRFLEVRKTLKEELWNEALTAGQMKSLQVLWEGLNKIRRTVRKEVTIYTEKNEEWLVWPLKDLKGNYEKTKAFLDNIEAELNQRTSELGK